MPGFDRCRPNVVDRIEGSAGEDLVKIGGHDDSIVDSDAEQSDETDQNGCVHLNAVDRQQNHPTCEGDRDLDEYSTRASPAPYPKNTD